jgi:hypothetical protein
MYGLQKRIDPKPVEKDPLVHEGKIDVDRHSGKALIAITEAPDNNIYDWASSVYTQEGIKQTMISTGNHTDSVWQSILFQLMAALYVMQLKNIHIRDFCLEHNVYIKDLHSDGNMIGYWLYIINGIHYYVPNYGYLVVIDTNFKDVKQEEKSFMPVTGLENKFKIECKFFDGIDRVTECFDQFTNTFRKSKFDKSVTGIKVGYKEPSENILSLVAQIENDIHLPVTAYDIRGYTIDDDKSDISYYINKYFRMFLHNRVGSLIVESEKPNIIMDPNRSAFTKGMLLLHQLRNSFIWVVYVESNDNLARILTKEKPTDKEIKETIVDKNHLFAYSDYKLIDQSFEADTSKLNIRNQLDTYVISRNTM